MEIIKARARYTGDNSSSKYYENNSFHYIKIKQEGSSIKIIAEEDTSENKISKTQYSSLADFFDVWNIYSVISIIRKLMERLTRENFWQEMRQRYPEGVKKFHEWLEEDKKKDNWNELFASKNFGDGVVRLPNYEELPLAIQYAIFYEFVAVFATDLGGGEDVAFNSKTTETIEEYLAMVNGIQGSLILT